MKFSYLAIDLGAVIIPLLFSFHRKLQFHRNWKPFFIACFLTAVPFLFWDSQFTELGVWGFNANYLTGIYLFNLPIEEILFFVCIPYACVFTWHALGYLFVKSSQSKFGQYATVALVIALASLAAVYGSKLYSFVTFASLAGLLLILQFVLKAKWLGRFYLTYGVLLVPFFVVNGLLTGYSLEEPIVWYNNDENMGIRLTTIPMEDIFYGMLLILMNVSIYEFLKPRLSR